MAVWLMKTEPDEFSIDDLQRLDKAKWDGVRNYQARNFMREMSLGDLVLIYHSSCKVPAIVGTASISKTVHPDPSCWDKNSVYYDKKSTESAPRWDQVELTFLSKLSNQITLLQLKSITELAGFELTKKGSRLSVMPVPEEYLNILTRRFTELRERPINESN